MAPGTDARGDVAAWTHALVRCPTGASKGKPRRHYYAIHSSVTWHQEQMPVVMLRRGRTPWCTASPTGASKEKPGHYYAIRSSVTWHQEQMPVVMLRRGRTPWCTASSTGASKGKPRHYLAIRSSVTWRQEQMPVVMLRRGRTPWCTASPTRASKEKPRHYCAICSSATSRQGYFGYSGGLLGRHPYFIHLRRMREWGAGVLSGGRARLGSFFQTGLPSQTLLRRAARGRVNKESMLSACRPYATSFRPVTTTLRRHCGVIATSSRRHYGGMKAA